MARYGLNEAERRLIEPLLPNKVLGIIRVDDRSAINGIFSVSAIGADRNVPFRRLGDAPS